ncbi:triple tyrosine motif-containing protein [Kineobactrum salinum]|uniref:Uncharacterized protein n=1 Tax=Kineobactrum salinum TaxID=2708301 RepID=A0A6C0U2I3_9GAMM|nr:triple tyrosine motif-containing protein [Kineobactrum salinum]QIB66291.1 hypothetical protein G3T16_13630 [Kineobactrum salinum]
MDTVKKAPKPKFRLLPVRHSNFFVCCLHLYLALYLTSTQEALASGNSVSHRFSVVESALTSDLSQEAITSILHASNAVLWIVTLEGITRFEGAHRRTYNSFQDSDGNIVRSPVVQIIEIWNGDVLALLDSGELFTYRGFDDTFTEARWLNWREAGNSHATNIYFSNESGLWIGLKNGQVLQIAEDGARVAVFQPQETARISDISIGPRRSIVASNTSGIIYSIDPDSLDSTRLDLNGACKQSIYIKKVLYTKNTGFLVGSKGAGLFELDPNSGECKRLPPSGDSGIDFSTAIVFDIALLPHSNIIVIASDQGLLLLDQHRDLVSYFRIENSRLLNNEVIAIHPLDAQRTWIGTHNGINLLIQSKFELHDSNSHKLLHSIAGIASLPDGRAVIAAYDGILVADDGPSSHVTLDVYFPDADLTNAKVMSILVDGTTIYFGHRASGLEILDTETQKVRRINTQTFPDLLSDSISALLVTDSGDLLIGTYGGGLTMVTKDGKSQSFYPTAASDSLANERVIMLFQSSDGVIWVGSESGLQTFDPESPSFQEVKIANLHQPSRSHPIVWCMTETPDHGLWFGSMYDGIFKRITPSQNSSHQELVNVQFPLMDERRTIYAIESDSDNNLWVSSSKGISRLSPDQQTVHFNESHGLQQMEFEFGSSYRRPDGVLYFGGSLGYNRFNPTEIDTDTPPPSLRLTNINIAGRHIPVPSTLNQLESMVLDYDDHFVTFEFSALEFLDPGSTRYRHKLVGFDPEWIDIGNRSSATYTNLPTGDYQLRVQAANSGGIWNYEGIELDVKVEPPPWFSWWAYSIYSLAILLAAYAARRVYDTYMIKEQALRYAEEMQVAADRIADDLQDQIEFQAKLADSIHFYQRDVVVWAQHCEELTREYDCDAAGQASQMRKRLHALELLQDSLYYQGEQLYANLKVFTDHLFDYLAGLQGEKGRRFTIINELPDELTPASHAIALAVALTELVDNSLEHGFSDAAQACYIRVTLQVESIPEIRSDQLTLTYQDDGVGVPEALSMDAPDSAGFAIIAAAAQSVGGEISFVDQQRKEVQLQFNVPWIRELGASQAPARD